MRAVVVSRRPRFATARRVTVNFHNYAQDGVAVTDYHVLFANQAGQKFNCRLFDDSRYRLLPGDECKLVEGLGWWDLLSSDGRDVPVA